MKPGIHPTWYPDAIVVCACGNTWTTGSTKKEIHTDMCSACHPFYTGEQRIVDTAGQVERFMKRISAKEQIAAAQPAAEEKKSKKDKRRERKGIPGEETPAPRAPADLPLAADEAQPNASAAAPASGAVEVAPLVEPENFKPETNERLAPAGEIGNAASVDKIIEPTQDLTSAGKPEGEAKPRAPRKSGPRKPRASTPNTPPEEPKQE